MIKTNPDIDYGSALRKITENPFRTDLLLGESGELAGYTKCLSDLSNYLQVVTEYKPEKRFVDAVPILDGIAKASKELGEMMKKIPQPENDLPDEMYRRSKS